MNEPWKRWSTTTIEHGRPTSSTGFRSIGARMTSKATSSRRIPDFRPQGPPYISVQLRHSLRLSSCLEIARLYAETSTPTAEIREQFGIGDSSLYRIVQQQGIALRGRTASSTRPNAPRAQTPAARRLLSSSPKQAQEAVSQPGSNEAPTGARQARRVNARSGGIRVRRAPVTEKTAAPSDTASGTGKRQQFRILFMAERVVRATDMRDALRQAESLGATEITAVSRED